MQQTGPDFLLEDLVTYLSRATFADCVLRCKDGINLRTHCAVLAALSPRYLKRPVAELHPLQGEVHLCLPDFTSKEVSPLLELVYNGELAAVSEEQEVLRSLLAVLGATDDIMPEEQRVYEPVIDITMETQLLPKLHTAPKKYKKKRPQPIDFSVPKTTMTDASSSRAMMDQRTREMLAYNDGAGDGRGPVNRCRCILCTDPARVNNALNLHQCHYPECGKRYKKTSHLRAHLRGHVGEQPYMCSWPGCGKRFTRSDELHRHFRIHTGEKNHPCPYCDKKFSRSDHLKKHILSHINPNSLQYKPELAVLRANGQCPTPEELIAMAGNFEKAEQQYPPQLAMLTPNEFVDNSLLTPKIEVDEDLNEEDF